MLKSYFKQSATVGIATMVDHMSRNRAQKSSVIIKKWDPKAQKSSLGLPGIKKIN